MSTDGCLGLIHHTRGGGGLVPLDLPEVQPDPEERFPAAVFNAFRTPSCPGPIFFWAPAPDLGGDPESLPVSNWDQGLLTSLADGATFSSRWASLALWLALTADTATCRTRKQPHRRVIWERLGLATADKHIFFPSFYCLKPSDMHLGWN